MAKRAKARRTSPPPAVVNQAPRRRAYGGASISRLTSDWVTSGSSADAEVSSSLVRLRNRCRQLVRDNDYARAAIRAIRSNVIGSGIKLQAQVRLPVDAAQLDQQANDQIESGWASWGRADSCHTAGRMSFAALQAMLIGAMAESGEVFVRMVRQPFGRSRVPFALEILEADLLDEKKHGLLPGGDEWRMGIRVDSWGRPVEYAFLSRHPGDLQGGPAGIRHRMIPASEIIHLGILERPGQTRAVPWLAASIKQLHHLNGYQEAEVVRARAGSSLMAFITSPEGEISMGDDVEGDERVSDFAPGKFAYLAPGESVTVPDLQAPDGQFEPFLKAMLRSMAAGTGVPFTSLSANYSESNYSSSRLELLDARENWKALQQYMIDAFLTPVFEAWLDAAVLSGELQLPGYELAPDRYRAVRWMPRAWSWIDPAKEVAAYRDAVRSGFKTQAEVVAEQGGDLEEMLIARSAELDRADELDLVFDTNPAAVSAAGLTQARPVGSVLPQDPAAAVDTLDSTDSAVTDGANP
jgi:lambda family phage portal protein